MKATCLACLRHDVDLPAFDAAVRGDLVLHRLARAEDGVRALGRPALHLGAILGAFIEFAVHPSAGRAVEVDEHRSRRALPQHEGRQRPGPAVGDNRVRLPPGERMPQPPSQEADGVQQRVRFGVVVVEGPCAGSALDLSAGPAGRPCVRRQDVHVVSGF